MDRIKIAEGFKALKTLGKDAHNYQIVRKLEPQVLYELIHHPGVVKLPPKKLVILYSVVMKMHVVKFWQSKEIMQVFAKIAEYLSKLDEESIAAFASLLTKAKVKDER